MAAAAVASTQKQAPAVPAPGSASIRVAGSVRSLLPFRDRANELFAAFENELIDNDSTKDIIARRMALAQRLSFLLGEYGRDTRAMLLDGAALDFDLPLHIFDSMSKIMDRVARSSSDKLAPKLKFAAEDAAAQIASLGAKDQSDALRIQMAFDILKTIQNVHQELKRIMSSFGSFFQPLATIPAGFFNLPAISIQQKYLALVATHWAATASGVKQCIFAATDCERSVFHQQDAGANPEAIRVRKAIADALTFWVRIQHNGAELLKSQLIPSYLADCQQALARIGSKLSVKELLDVTVVRIDNEQDRFRQIFGVDDATPVRRVVQLGLVQSQVKRISDDQEVGLNAAMAQLPYADLFHKLVVMLDFDRKCIDSICEAVTRNVGSELGAYLARSQTEEDRGCVVDVVAGVYEKYRAAIASCQTTEQNKLRFYVAIRQGVNSGMGHAGLETTLVHHFHKLLKDAGALSPAEVQFLAFDLRAAVATFGPLLRDVDVFVRVYQHRLGTRLMSRKAPNPKLESFAVEELTGSIGNAYTHGMRAMIQQFSDATTNNKSAFNNNNNTNDKKSIPPSSLQPASTPSIPISKYTWPAFSMMSQSSVVLHPVIAEMTKNDVASFLAANNKQLLSASAHPLLTSVELRAANNAGIFGNAVQCSMLLFISELKQQQQKQQLGGGGGGGVTVAQLADKMKITEQEAYWFAETLVRSNVVTSPAPKTYALVPLESEKRIVLSSVWGTASRSAARVAKKVKAAAPRSSTSSSSSSSSPTKTAATSNPLDDDDDEDGNDSVDTNCVVQ